MTDTRHTKTHSAASANPGARAGHLSAGATWRLKTTLEAMRFQSSGEVGDYFLGVGIAGLVSNLLVLGFFTQIPALLAYPVSFLITGFLGCGSLYLSKRRRKAVAG